MNAIIYNKHLFLFGIILVMFWFVISGLSIIPMIKYSFVIVGLGLLTTSQIRFFIKNSKKQLQKEGVLKTYTTYFILLIMGNIIDFLFRNNFEVASYFLLSSYSLYIIFFISKKLLNNEKFIWY